MAEYQDEGLQPHRPIAYLLNNQWPTLHPIDLGLQTWPRTKRS
jgi:hypothetical protein